MSKGRSSHILTLPFETEHFPPHDSQIMVDHNYVPHAHSGDWDMALEAFLCCCGVTFPPQDDTVSHSFLPDPYDGTSPALSTLTSPSEANSLSCTFETPLRPLAYTPPLFMTQPSAPVFSSEHTCLWNGCGSSFPSLAELISHVNISHLRTYSSQLPEPVATPSSYLRLSSDAFGLSCQWGNCHEYSSTPLSTSSSPGLDDALNSLTGHLLHDHLGLQGGLGDHTMMTTKTAALADAVLPVPTPNSGQDVEMRSEVQPSDIKQQDALLSGSAKQIDVKKGDDEQQHRTTDEDKTQASATGAAEKCCWRGCDLSFESIDELMNHLTTEHVGSGKNHYECFWRGCERSGKNGFTSKQKVCRHLQVCVDRRRCTFRPLM